MYIILFHFTLHKFYAVCMEEFTIKILQCILNGVGKSIEEFLHLKYITRARQELTEQLVISWKELTMNTRADVWIGIFTTAILGSLHDFGHEIREFLLAHKMLISL